MIKLDQRNATLYPLIQILTRAKKYSESIKIRNTSTALKAV